MTELWGGTLALLAGGVAAVVRAAFIRASAGSAVDHHYWILAANAYRQAGRLPVSIPNKYLLEDERQSYPPFLGWLLARFPQSWLTGWRPFALVQAADVATLLLLIAYAVHLGATMPAIAVLTLVYGTAPVLVAYNTQLASRAFGNLFFTASVLAQVKASTLPITNPEYVWWFAGATLAAAAVIVTHKMTTQLMIALWPLWPLVLNDALIALVVPAGLGLSVLITGPRFTALQWRAHADIVAFWHRHRDALGAHAFEHSPVYGDPSRTGEKAFHKPGWLGVRSHAALAFGYCPLLWLAPMLLVAVPPLPWWVLAWAGGAATVALFTLFVPALRCLGGGHLYLFNAVAPAALWWAGVPLAGDLVAVAGFTTGLVATGLALWRGYRRRLRAHSRADRGFQAAIEHLAKLPGGRVAVFPVTAADEVACRTPHAVLWGGHGYGFRRLEPIFPVIREPLSVVLQKNGCDWLLLDERYWPGGLQRLSPELRGAHVTSFGTWNLLTLRGVDDDRAGKVASA